MKKLFIISLVLLGIVVVFLGVYNFAFKQKPSVQTQVPAVKKSASTNAPERISAVSDQAVIGTAFDKKNEALVYYEAKDGTAWREDPDGNGKQLISDSRQPGIKNVEWSLDRNKVLTTIEKNGQGSFYEYDYQTKTGLKLKDGLDTAVWDNMGVKIFYKYFDAATKTRTLNMANPDGSEWQKLADVPFRNISIAPIPLTSLVSFWNFPSAAEETKLMAVGASGGEPQVVFSGKFGADYLWSPDGTQALVSYLPNKNNKMVTLGLVSVNGEYHDLNIPTLAAKCTWSSDGKTLYYALPGGIPEGATMPDDYQNGKFSTEDTFWKMNIATGEKSRIIEARDIKGKYDSSDLFLSANEGSLYFINKIDSKLYRLAF